MEIKLLNFAAKLFSSLRKISSSSAICNTAGSLVVNVAFTYPGLFCEGRIH
jgi:hypothetical protein